MKTAFSLAKPPSMLDIKRAAFPLAGPRYQTLCWWPVTVACAAIDGYFEAFFAAFRWETLE